MLLAALSQEHVLYIGPPGTAKSELGRRLSRLCAGTFFERLLTRFSVPEVSSHIPCIACLAHNNTCKIKLENQKGKGKNAVWWVLMRISLCVLLLTRTIMSTIVSCHVTYAEDFRQETAGGSEPQCAELLS